MKTNYMMTAEDVATELGISKGHAYKLIRQLIRMTFGKFGFHCGSRKSAESVLGEEILWLSRNSTDSIERRGIYAGIQGRKAKYLVLPVLL